jgi:hypothetical protein
MATRRLQNAKPSAPSGSPIFGSLSALTPEEIAEFIDPCDVMPESEDFTPFDPGLFDDR